MSPCDDDIFLCAHCGQKSIYKVPVFIGVSGIFALKTFWILGFLPLPE
jgi:hypothetical protein